MLYLVIGFVVFMAVGAFLKQGKRDAATPHTQPPEGAPPSFDALVSDATTDLSPAATPIPIATTPEVQAGPQVFEPAGTPALREEPAPLNPVLAASPISSPSAVSGATYSSSAPAALGNESPYSYSASPEAKKPQSDPALLRWCGKTGSLQIGEFVVRGAVTYWSDGPSKTPDPCCIDVSLPVEFPDEKTDGVSPDGAISYAEMSPLQRGHYLMWLAGGRIQPPPHAYCPLVWLYGLERRVLVDKLDLGMCLGEAFRLLPLLRWDALRQAVTRFVTWLAAKIWLPEEQILAFCRSLAQVPLELLDMLLRPYADAKLPLPSAVAFTLMRTSTLLQKAALEGQGDLEKTAVPLPHSEELLSQFVPLYKNACHGGVVLPKPKSFVFLACVPTNPSLASEQQSPGAVLELPDFFKDLGNFAPLFPAWREFLQNIRHHPAHSGSEKEAESLADRPDLEGFVQTLRGTSEGSSQDAENLEPVVSDLAALGDLLKIEHGGPEEKARGGDRKKIVEVARVEGYLVLPDLGVTGKEYHWGDPIVLTPLEMGARLSKDYNAAALLLEFACSMTETRDIERFDAHRTRLDDYFSLSSDDHSRLSALAPLLLTNLPDPKELGEIFQMWIQQGQREVLKDFLFRFLTTPDPEEGQTLQSRICALLDLPDAPLRSEEPPLKLGEEIVDILAPLFKD